LSDALADTITVPETGPGAGPVIVTVGAVASGGGPLFATITGAEVYRTPRTSRVTAVNVYAPLPIVVVCQGIAEGLVVSSAPRLTPLSLNWTPATVTAPMLGPGGGGDESGGRSCAEA
jgi:hypothetical protein